MKRGHAGKGIDRCRRIFRRNGGLAGDVDAAPPGALKGPRSEVYYREAAELYKQKINIPLMLVGGIRSFEVAEELLRSKTADYIALSRPLIAEPELVKRWRAAINARPTAVPAIHALAQRWREKGSIAFPRPKDKPATKVSLPRPETRAEKHGPRERKQKRKN